MTSTLANALLVLGLVGGFGALGLLLGRDLDRTGRHGRDNWHRPTGYPADPGQPDRLHRTAVPTAVPTAVSPAVPAADAPAADAADRLRGTLPAASDLRLGTLVRWTSSSAPRSKQTCTPQAR
ncbi:hypothetical protein ACFW1A_07455 [Kitasatospora sp. NPDC058965]|uniref:hypothetical protein n=1 Tax=Kitasatospora sp. NPDC058965 TaxID=3346682 RepID=UPI0036946BA0